MPITVQRGILWGWEACFTLDMLINGEEPAKTRDALVAKLPTQTEVLREMFALPVAAFESARAVVDASNPTLRFLFTRYEGFDGAPFQALLGTFFPAMRGELDKAALLQAHSEIFHEMLCSLFSLDASDADVPPPPEDMRALFQWLQAKDTPDAVQAALLRVYTQTEALLDTLIPALQSAMAALRKHEAAFAREAERFAHLTQSDLLASLEALSLSIDHAVDYHAYPIIMQVNGMDITAENSISAPLMRIGARLFELMPLVESARLDVASAQAALHTMTDKTKLEILIRLAERPWYGTELAEALSLSGATVSHHVGQLLGHSLISVENVKNRLYYRLDSGRVRELLDSLGQLLRL